MSTHDVLLEKWQGKLADGSHADCMDASALAADSFCVVFDMCWGGPQCGMVSMLTPEYFDTPADFVAFVRVVELPRSLDMMLHGDGPIRPAEDYLPLVDAESRALTEAVVTAADAALARHETTGVDAETVIAAFNALFGRHGDAKFTASGGIADVFAAERIHDLFDAWSEDADDLLDTDEPQMIVKRLLDSGEFDLHRPEHLEMARELLAAFPNS